MNILANKYTESESNWVKTISIDGVDFIGTDLLTCAIWNAKDFLDWKLEYEEFEFDWEREFYRFSWNYFIVKYSDKSLRDKDKQELANKWEFNKFWKAEKDKDWFQIPMTDFVVDYDWSYYLMIEWTKKLDEELTDVSKWVFKSMIIDLDRFNWISNDIRKQVKKVGVNVRGLLEKTEFSKQELQEKADYWAWIFLRTLREEEKINVSSYREVETNIDLLLNFIIEEMYLASWYETKEQLIKNDLILDDISKSYLKTEKIEWINFSFEELTKKMWDLFYEPLASILNSIALELEKQIEDNEKIVKLLKESSNHILEAWTHCKPYITDINELEKNSKHTFNIEWTELSNEQISRAIAYLDDNKLKEFLILLSNKIYIDAEADKWRNRLKLAWELFATAEKLKEAWEKIV